jgi:hypothetical protein
MWKNNIDWFTWLNLWCFCLEVPLFTKEVLSEIGMIVITEKNEVSCKVNIYKLMNNKMTYASGCAMEKIDITFS